MIDILIQVSNLFSETFVQISFTISIQHPFHNVASSESHGSQVVSQGTTLRLFHLGSHSFSLDIEMAWLIHVDNYLQCAHFCS